MSFTRTVLITTAIVVGALVAAFNLVKFTQATELPYWHAVQIMTECAPGEFSTEELAVEVDRLEAVGALKVVKFKGNRAASVMEAIESSIGAKAPFQVDEVWAVIFPGADDPVNIGFFYKGCSQHVMSVPRQFYDAVLTYIQKTNV